MILSPSLPSSTLETTFDTNVTTEISGRSILSLAGRPTPLSWRLGQSSPRLQAGDAPSPGSAYLPSPGSAYLPSTGSAFLPSTGNAYLPSPGNAYLQSPGSAYLQSSGSAYLQSPGSAYVPSPGSAYPPRGSAGRLGSAEPGPARFLYPAALRRQLGPRGSGLCHVDVADKAGGDIELEGIAMDAAGYMSDGDVLGKNIRADDITSG